MLACPALLLSCAALAQDGSETAPPPDGPAGWVAQDWDLEDSEFTPEAEWHFGKLPNGLRYIIRRNDRPEQTAIVRMQIGAGSLDERDDERGFAHYVEHMAFNGSTNVPEGEMVRILEREGLAFGADTNASTGFERTEYRLNLPRADPALLDTALMLMRETASELTFDPAAVDRERGVILAERRTRNTYSLKNTADALEFAYPDARLARRLPIGTIDSLNAADAAGLQSFWAREYVPADTVVTIIGDFEPAAMEDAIRARFADWEPTPSPDQPSPGPIEIGRRSAVDIYLDPALTETVQLQQSAPYRDLPDTLANRRNALLVNIGNAVFGPPPAAPAAVGRTPISRRAIRCQRFLRTGAHDKSDGHQRGGAMADRPGRAALPRFAARGNTGFKQRKSQRRWRMSVRPCSMPWRAKTRDRTARWQVRPTPSHAKLPSPSARTKHLVGSTHLRTLLPPPPCWRHFARTASNSAIR